MTIQQVIHFWIDQLTRFISPQAVAAEWVLVAFVILLLALVPGALFGWLSRLADFIRRFAAHKRAAVAFCGILPLVLRLSMLSIYPVPEPSIHDEFSHLLLADTLAHGRLSNPTHPMWQHFESIHIIQKPTYSSMYPPANGVFMAAGQILFHEPWAGVLLSVGIMFAAMCWMMQQWLPPTWAFYGTLIAIARIGIFGLFINSYLGGSVSALGGALVIGAVPSLRAARGTAAHCVSFGAGLVILMNSRPFEGAVLVTAALLYILPAQVKHIRSAGWVSIRSAWTPAFILVVAGFLFTGYYSYRVTGSPLKMPYAVNRDTYGWPENLAFLPVHAVRSRHKVLRDMYAMEVQRRNILTRWDWFVDDKGRRIFENWAVLIGPLLTIPLLAGIIWRRRLRPLLGLIGLIAFLNLFQLVLYPYHLGPLVSVIFALTAGGMCEIFRRLSSISPGAGLVLAFTLPVCLLFASGAKQEADQIGLPLTYWERTSEPHGEPRAYIEHWLSNRGRKQLVVVRYAPDHSPNQEWVYNRADIDGSKVVWAREMDPEDNARLVHYFNDREAWLLEADVAPQHLVPYGMGLEREKAIAPADVCRCEDGSE